ncbi:low choriolytic enzyme-like [Salminus brasiliensis]|uniref:low choriolytic enzyme-like n=1 Tax=Salminus brasiliensis TaxID=930266 RepID=UPI003B82C7FC
MFVNKVTVGLLALLVVCSVKAEEEDPSAELSVGELLERANRDITRDFDEPELIGDIAVDDKRNADPCTSRGCMWPKSSDGKVYVPYVISNQYSSREVQVIQRGLDSFSSVSCIRFMRRSSQRDYLSIESRNGCYSYVGRRGNAQTVSLARSGCVYHKTVQHELLHALGFNHEQTRSDRDNHIRVMWENIVDGMKHNFNKIATLNQGTPYDYNSVMQYHKTAFSKNGKPTMVPIPNSNVPFGQATQMSQNDINRLNRLYKCYCIALNISHANSIITSTASLPPEQLCLPDHRISPPFHTPPSVSELLGSLAIILFSNLATSGTELNPLRRRRSPPGFIRDYLQDLGVERMEWPASSPDLNSMKHLWDQLGRAVRVGVTKTTTSADLRQMLVEEWDDIPQHCVTRLVTSMRRRRQAAVAVYGSSTRY